MLGSRVRSHASFLALLLLSACRDPPATAIPPLPSAAAPSPHPDEDPAKAVLASTLPSGSTDGGGPAGFVPERVQGTGAAMGTHVAFAAYTTPELDAAKAQAAFDAA